jgi:hypothetical protein
MKEQMGLVTPEVLRAALSDMPTLAEGHLRTALQRLAFPKPAHVKVYEVLRKKGEMKGDRALTAAERKGTHYKAALQSIRLLDDGSVKTLVRRRGGRVVDVSGMVNREVEWLPEDAGAQVRPRGLLVLREPERGPDAKSDEAFVPPYVVWDRESEEGGASHKVRDGQDADEEDKEGALVIAAPKDPHDEAEASDASTLQRSIEDYIVKARTMLLTRNQKVILKFADAVARKLGLSMRGENEKAKEHAARLARYLVRRKEGESEDAYAARVKKYAVTVAKSNTQRNQRDSDAAYAARVERVAVQGGATVAEYSERVLGLGNSCETLLSAVFDIQLAAAEAHREMRDTPGMLDTRLGAVDYESATLEAVERLPYVPESVMRAVRAELVAQRRGVKPRLLTDTPLRRLARSADAAGARPSARLAGTQLLLTDGSTPQSSLGAVVPYGAATELSSDVSYYPYATMEVVPHRRKRRELEAAHEVNRDLGKSGAQRRLDEMRVELENLGLATKMAEKVKIINGLLDAGQKAEALEAIEAAYVVLDDDTHVLGEQEHATYGEGRGGVEPDTDSHARGKAHGAMLKRLFERASRL